jgi:carboxypeptidase C (cathepsin A)
LTIPALARAALALLLLATPALAQSADDAPHAHPGPPSPSSATPAPADSTTKHQVTIDGKTLDLVATVTAIPLRDPSGKAQAEVVATSFILPSADPRTRPVTFAVNGGPGSGSAFLDLGALGPWRLPIGGDTIIPSTPPRLVDNQESWLPFTDLVFLDPPGTGWARVLGGEEVRKSVWSVNGDITALASAMRRWLEDNGRLGSPKLVVGESYGGFRGPRLVASLRDQGVGVGGLVLVSPVLDFGHRDEANDPWPWMTHLPSYAAIAQGARSRAAVADAESYAAGDYLLDFTRGLGDDDAVARMSERVAALAHLDPALVRRRAGRVDSATFLHERGLGNGTEGSYYDGLVTALDPFPEQAFAHAPDPVLDALRAPLGGAADALYRDRLHWHGEGQYRLLNDAVNRAWDYGQGRDPESTDALRGDLALDPTLRVVVAHGLYDLVTPYLASELLLQQVPARIAGDRLRLLVTPGGHMLYTQDASRAALRDAGQWAASAADAEPPGAAPSGATGSPPPGTAAGARGDAPAGEPAPAR